MVCAAFIYPLVGIPQVVEVFGGNIEGVSLFSWTGFVFFALLFLMYGIIHKIKPMIITNVLWLIVDGMVIGGALIHGAGFSF